MTEEEPTGPKRAVPADALSASEFDRLKALVEVARSDPAAVVVPAPAPVPVVPEVEDDEDVDEDDSPSRLGRILLHSVLAVVVGVALGVGGAWAAGRFDGPSPPPGAAPPSRALTAPPSPVGPSPVAPSAVAPPTRPAETSTANANNSRIAPTITALEVLGTNLVLRWRDATSARATFIVIRVTQGRGEPVDTLPPGSTEYVLEGVDPAAGPYCFLVIAVVGQDRGVSPTRCAS
jgi:hypothetical protein